MVLLRIVATVRRAWDAFLFSLESRSNSAVGAIIERVTPHYSFGQGPVKAPGHLRRHFSRNLGHAKARNECSNSSLPGGDPVA